MSDHFSQNSARDPSSKDDPVPPNSPSHQSPGKPARSRRRAHHAISQQWQASGAETGERKPDSLHVHQLHFKERVRHFTWTWFTMTMATGGIANVLAKIPYRFPGVYTLGCIFFLLNIALFLFNAAMIALRFRYHPATFRASILHPSESLFIPASVISLGTILLNVTEYGLSPAAGTGAWLLTTMDVLFWVYCGLAVCFSCGIYLTLWSTTSFAISTMTPIWIFPCYPLLVIGPHAGALAQHLAPSRPAAALRLILGGFVFQGIGFLLSLMIYAAFIYRLMTQKLPPEPLRPGMFVSVGPSGFTISGIVTMGLTLPSVVPETFLSVPGPLAAQISLVTAIWAGLWLWGLALWFFLVALGAHYSCLHSGRLPFSMTFYSYVFPNSALTTATLALALALDSPPLRILGCAMTVLLVITWLAVCALMVRAVWRKDLLWPQKQEDREEGGWKVPHEGHDAGDVRRWSTQLQYERDERKGSGSLALGGTAAATARRMSGREKIGERANEMGEQTSRPEWIIAEPVRRVRSEGAQCMV